jgi:hypothetical protein
VTFLNAPPKENLKWYTYYFVHNLTLLQFPSLSILLTQCRRFIDIVDIDDVLSTWCRQIESTRCHSSLWAARSLIKEFSMIFVCGPSGRPDSSPIENSWSLLCTKPSDSSINVKRIKVHRLILVVMTTLLRLHNATFDFPSAWLPT